MNKCNFDDIEPGVIDNAMITKCLIEYGPKGEAGRLFAEDGLHLEETPVVRMEFQNIIRIDHLWMLRTSLKKLTLAHNVIEKIENLEQLTQLNELDLSFNKIRKIENLDALVNLEMLTLCHNQITKLENLEALEKLLVFSIGDNLIDDFMDFSYLRRFRYLRSVSLAGNPCCADRGALDFVKCALVKVTYLDYKTITAKERARGLKTFRDTLRELNEADETAEKQRIAKKEYEARVKYHSLSFVEHLSGPELLEAMFENDPDAQLILEVGGEVLKSYELYKEEYVETMQCLVAYAHESYNQRQQEMGQYKELMDSALADTVKRSKAEMAIFEGQKAPIFHEMHEIISNYHENSPNITELDIRFEALNETFYEALHVLWRALMEIEMQFYEQCEESRVEFSGRVTDTTTRLLEAARASFGAWREAELRWTATLHRLLPGWLEGGGASAEVSPRCLEVLSDRDTLHDCIAQSSDIHMRSIDTREDTLNSRANRWREDLVMKTNRDEINRNRGRVLEINFYADNQRATWLDLQLLLTAPTESEAQIMSEAALLMI